MNKSDYICSVPFSDIEIHDHGRNLCCASWLTKWLPENATPYDSWNSTEANDIRNSMLNGSYQYCNNNCPFLNELETTGKPGHKGPIHHTSNLSTKLKSNIDKHKQGTLLSPSAVIFSMDRSCNLKCPSCRLDLIMADSSKIRKVKKDIQDIEDSFSHEITKLTITGSGDPFISVGFRDFLRTFDSKKWPKLEIIHLHTNGTKWNPKMWKSMENIHTYVKSCEISIDASTKDTYENKTRLGGNWDELMENLEFIKTIPTLQTIKTSFVVQSSNYKEMKSFYDLMLGIFGKKVNVFFNKITNWGMYSDEEFLSKKIWDISHKEHSEFIEMVNKVLPAENSYNNLQEFITKKELI